MIEKAVGPGPYPPQGFHKLGDYYLDGVTQGKPKHISGPYPTMLMAAQAMAQSVGLPGCGRVRRQLMRRGLPPGSNFTTLPLSSDTELYPTWAFVPYPDPAAA